MKHLWGQSVVVHETNYNAICPRQISLVHLSCCCQCPLLISPPLVKSPLQQTICNRAEQYADNASDVQQCTWCVADSTDHVKIYVDLLSVLYSRPVKIPQSMLSLEIKTDGIEFV